MNKYEKLANEIEERIIYNKGYVELTPEEAMRVLNYLRGMDRIQKIAESEYGGAELFR